MVINHEFVRQSAEDVRLILVFKYKSCDEKVYMKKLKELSGRELCVSRDGGGGAATIHDLETGGDVCFFRNLLLCLCLL